MKLARPTLGLLTMALISACGDAADTSAPTSQTETSPPTSIVAEPDTLVTEGVNSGRYHVAKDHATIIWTVSHNGLSRYTARFTEFDIAIDLNAEKPTASSVTATINPLSVRTDHPNGPDWDTTLGTDEKWFNAAAFPAIVFKSTGALPSSERSGTLNGELTLLGISQEVPVDVTYNGVRNFPWYGERDVIGFSATASLKRSDFGMLALLPDIGDEVAVTIEAEFVEAEAATQ